MRCNWERWKRTSTLTGGLFTTEEGGVGVGRAMCIRHTPNLPQFSSSTCFFLSHFGVVEAGWKLQMPFNIVHTAIGYYRWTTTVSAKKNRARRKKWFTRIALTFFLNNIFQKWCVHRMHRTTFGMQKIMDTCHPFIFKRALSIHIFRKMTFFG